MNRTVLALSILPSIVAFSASETYGYEIYTHAELTHQAAIQSVLADVTIQPGIQSLWGIELEKDANAAQFRHYYEVCGGCTPIVKDRQVTEYEKSRAKEFKVYQNTDPITFWLMTGAIREDDLGKLYYLPGIYYWKGENPQDETDMPRPFWRVMYHFYDPVNNRPLTFKNSLQQALFATVTQDTTDFRAVPAWAMGTKDAFLYPTQPEAGRLNHFSLQDAREAIYRATTGKTKEWGDAGPNNTPADWGVRKAYWATALRALGDTLHLNQDMAQPQHTHNDPHSMAYRWNVEVLA